MKKNNKIIVLLFSVIALSFTACIDNSLNVNPNNATELAMSRDDLKVGAFFTQMQRNVFIVGADRDGAYQRQQNLAGDVFAGYMGATNNWFGGSNSLTYNPNPDWYNEMFNNGYGNIMSPWNEIQKITKEEFPQKYAAATIIKVAGMHRVTDTYGPIPYTEYGTQIYIPYDSQEKVYNTFFEELTEAVDILTDFYAETAGARLIAAEYDYIYQGNPLSWIKFANSLRLRLAMRISYVNPTKARTEAEAAINHVHGVMTSVGDIAALNRNSRFTYNHPLNEICYNFTDVKMGATMDSYLNGYSDGRREIYFNRASSGNYVGVRSGITISSKDTYANPVFSDLNVSTGTSVVWMNPAEVFFLRAEGAVRGWSMGGTAQELYEQGITTSFTYTGAPNVTAYISSTAVPAAYTDPQTSGNSNAALGTVTVRWSDAATDEARLEKIITQKWIAMYPDGQEAWSEFRRTAYPKVFPVRVNNSGGRVDTSVQIRRLPYSSSEYRDNAANVAAATALLGGADHGGIKLWWDKK